MQTVRHFSLSADLGLSSNYFAGPSVLIGDRPANTPAMDVHPEEDDMRLYRENPAFQAGVSEMSPSTRWHHGPARQAAG
ncbi:hypothetical protein BLL38_17790 [Pseudomonas gessardii]|jgi:hypothetical protein|nr:hypothetical protein BLL38_17790 [Pseudomonas gessardii]